MRLLRALPPVCVLLLSASGCINPFGCGGIEYPQSQIGRVTIPQGLWGNVWFWEGDFMPGCPSGTITPVARTVYVHELTAQDQVTHAGAAPDGFFAAVHSRQVTVVQADARGFWQVALPPGRYSVFVREGDRYYASDYNAAAPFVAAYEVWPGVITHAQVDIGYLKVE